MHLVNVAITHKTAPLEVRERFGFTPEYQLELLGRWRAVVPEAVLLVTCHRTELYWVAESPRVEPGLEWLAAAAGLSPNSLAEYVSVAVDARAARHLMQVAAGLDSRVLGETQILGQVRRARATAQSAGTLGPVTDRLFSLALASGRAARVAAGLGRGDRSLASLAVLEVERRLGELARCSVLVLGAGETGRLLVTVLRRRRARAIWWSNRTQERFPRWVQEDGIHCLDWSVWPTVLADVDAVFVATGAPHAVLTRRHFGAATSVRVVVDLAVPRNVDPAVETDLGIPVITVDALRDETWERTCEGERARAQTVVETYVERFLRWFRAHALGPELAATQAVMRTVCEREISRALHRSRRTDVAPEAIVECAAWSITDKLLVPIYRAIQSDPQRAAEVLRLLRQT